MFVADKLSELNKTQLDTLQIEWVEMRDHKGYKRFYEVLKRLKIPCEDFTSSIDNRLNEIFKEIYLTA